MSAKPIITREVSPLPRRADDAHKGDVGRLVIIGGCCGETAMIGAPALAANAAFRSGVGLVQVLVPEGIRGSVAVLAPCATTRTLPTEAESLLAAVQDFRADVVAVGTGLGDSLSSEVLVEFLLRLDRPVVVDADGLNLLASGGEFTFPDAARAVLTPHPGEIRRLLSARGIDERIDSSASVRQSAACRLAETYGCVAVLKGQGTVVTNGRRVYVNETGNSGMATGGTGDVLTGMIAALIGQRMDPLEAAILAVYLHGLAGDFASEELGRWSMTATDLIDYLPEAFWEHDLAET